MDRTTKGIKILFIVLFCFCSKTVGGSGLIPGSQKTEHCNVGVLEERRLMWVVRQRVGTRKLKRTLREVVESRNVLTE